MQNAVAETLNFANTKYIEILEEAKSKITSCRIRAAKAASREQFNLYWWFGQKIWESQEQYTFKSALPQHLAEQAERAMKDIYMLDTLGLTPPVLEAEIENRMVNKIKTVMLELGYGFTFIGNQHRIIANGDFQDSCRVK
ncbi:MAG TPA: PDDEXK nuclease domain-containing protein [Gammaproteobacteria bacterium]|nr:PDDEXK nuclease domain-containing protein [Gammaproteobacteria bacterium]